MSRFRAGAGLSHWAMGLLLSAMGLLPQLCQAWPSIALPPRAVAQDMGGPMVHNGTPMRSFGFVSPDKPGAVTAWFEKSLGQPVARSAQGRAMVLAKYMDGFFVTVQIEATFPGTRGLIGITDMRTAAETREDYRARLTKLQERLPVGSVIKSHSTSVDGSRKSMQLLFTNTSSMAINSSHLVGMLKGEGYALERQTSSSPSGSSKPGEMLYFRGDGREATATITLDSQGHTAVFLVTVAGG
ncbi:MAG: hypothetical protein C4K60_20725 [Ideonella sp. MAG2]|nr:MAG: hypothetical protein C4K60_20725 [Ideonella sp. MAG2]